MLSHDHFYFEMFRKYIVAFNHIISDIHVLRSKNGVTLKDITVPISYAAKSKMFQVLSRSSKADRKIRTILPRISFIINSMVPDPTRKLNNLNECTIESDGKRESFQYIGKPYNFGVELNIWTIYMDDLLQIIEQLATFFNPDYTMIVNEIKEFGITKNIPVVLNGINFDIENEFDTEDRILRASAAFTIKGYLYPPLSEDKLIRHMTIMIGDLDTQEIDETIKIDWDELSETAITTIKTGRPYYEFTSQVNINSSAISNNYIGD